MTLSGTEFEQISEWLAVSGESESSEHQRRSPRVGVQATVAMKCVDSGDETSVRVRNISTSGIGILHTSQLKLDQRFVVMLPRYGQMLPVMCSVVYWEPLAKGVFGIGAKFEEVLEESGTVEKQERTVRHGPITKLVHAIERKMRKAS